MKYSEHNLIQEKIMELRGQKKSGLLQLIFPKKRPETLPLDVVASEDDILRADHFIDVIRNSAEHFYGPIDLDIATLISFAYQQFMQEVQSGITQSALIRGLTERQNKYFGQREQTEELDQASDTHWIRTNKVQIKKQKLYQVKITFSRETVYAGELLLRELHRSDPSFHFTLEQLISILFAHFIQQLRSRNIEDVVENILDSVYSLT